MLRETPRSSLQRTESMTPESVYVMISTLHVCILIPIYTCVHMHKSRMPTCAGPLTVPGRQWGQMKESVSMSALKGSYVYSGAI